MSDLYQAEHYSLLYPPTWSCEIVRSGVTFFRQDGGRGAINISTVFNTEERWRATDLFRDFARGLAPKVLNSSQQDVTVLTSAVVEDGVFWRYWVVARPPVGVTVTYNCREADQDFEMDDVAAIVGSIRIIEPDQ